MPSDTLVNILARMEEMSDMFMGILHQKIELKTNEIMNDIYTTEEMEEIYEKMKDFDDIGKASFFQEDFKKKANIDMMQEVFFMASEMEKVISVNMETFQKLNLEYIKSAKSIEEIYTEYEYLAKLNKF